MKEWFQAQVESTQEKIQNRLTEASLSLKRNQSFEVMEVVGDLPRLSAQLSVYQTILSMYEQGVSPGRIREIIIRKMSVFACMVNTSTGMERQFQHAFMSDAYARALEVMGDNFVSVYSLKGGVDKG